MFAWTWQRRRLAGAEVEGGFVDEEVGTPGVGALFCVLRPMETIFFLPRLEKGLGLKTHAEVSDEVKMHTWNTCQSFTVSVGDFV